MSRDRRLAELQKAMDSGDYRAVYTIEDGELILWVLTVANRRDVYRNL